jgi:hypothetical protein
VLLDGKEFYVRENLWDFLQIMRLDGRWRLFWIDAICIDQSNILERNHQVNQMSQIYSQADLVIVWLGNAGTFSDIAIEYIAGEAFLDPQSERTNDSASLRRLEKALRSFFHRSYWSRVWIIQELILARDVIFFAGQKSFTWHHISSTRKRSKDFDHPNWHQYDLRHAYECTAYSPAWLLIGQKTLWEALPHSQKHLPILELLDIYKNHKCTDPRDRVYGLLGLARDNLVKADYTISVEDLYFAVLQIIDKDYESRMSPNLRSAIFALQVMLRLKYGIALLSNKSRLPRYDERLKEVEDIHRQALELASKVGNAEQLPTLMSVAMFRAILNSAKT